MGDQAVTMQLDPRFTEGQRKRLENQRARAAEREAAPEFLPPEKVTPCRFIKRVPVDVVITPSGERVRFELQ